jgi:hypothetical protein
MNHNMKQPIFVLFIAILSAFSISSCTSASKEELLPPGCKTDDSLFVASYTSDVVPIFESHCYACHGSNSHENSGVDLQDTTVLNKYIESGELLGNITHAPGYDPMPQDAPKMDTCDISVIHVWILQGAPKN